MAKFLYLFRRKLGNACARAVDPARRRYAGFVARLSAAQLLGRRVIRIGRFRVAFPAPDSLLFLYRDTFYAEQYKFPARTDTPTILDLGANIGITVLYFKSLYPGAKIVAFEPDPDNFRYLTENARGNDLKDVELINKAIWDETGSLPFAPRPNLGSRAATGAEREADLVSVEAVDIREVLASRDFDFIKIDIEGAEGRVLAACRGLLGPTRHLFLECHSRVGQPQELGPILDGLAEAGFRVQVQSALDSPRPFVKPPDFHGFDGLYNIFASRPEPPAEKDREAE